jgi:KUP system potassium uptake protein
MAACAWLAKRHVQSLAERPAGRLDLRLWAVRGDLEHEIEAPVPREHAEEMQTISVARVSREIPPLVVWHLRHIRALHGTIAILNVVTEMAPYVAEEKRLRVRQIAPQVWRNRVHYGFMEQPDLPALLERARVEGYPVDSSRLTYFIGRETVVRRKDGKGLPWLVVIVFAFMLRNSSEAIDYLHLPRDEVVEIGRQFAI